ncbi:MAG: arylesterase [Betaproteobacteria bacterium]
MNFSYCNRPVIASRPSRFRVWLLQGLLALFALGVHAAPASTSPAVLVIGDSLSAGYGLATGQGWVDLLQKKLLSQGFQYRVVNASISGDTTAGGRSRIAASMATHRPAIVIIELGGNDGLRGNTLAPVKANLEYMVEAARRAGAQVLLLGMQLPPNYGTTYVRQFSSLFADVAKAHDVAYVPFILQGFGEKPELFQADRIHPNAQAQPLMVENVWPELKKLIARRH